MENKVLKTKSAAAYLAVSPWKLRNLVHEGKMAYISDGDNTSALRFRVKHLDDYLERYTVPAATDFRASSA
ncbi:MAG: helix-turn-helix domain-containing protein [Acidobacteriota bacterium]|nr:helix-turn-helix domain-containing protein [Acidobacteriota bacterium]